MISIIIPVYNVEKFLVKCLDSIKKQTYKEIEVILINDGSTDKSGLICDDYCRQDNRFKVKHKSNGGVSSARNLGLSIARGDYVCFVDPDDYIEPNMIENLFKLTQEYDVELAACGYLKEKEGTILNEIGKSEILLYQNNEPFNEILKVDSFKGFLCNKIFSYDLIKRSNNLTFDENIHFCEDLLFVCKCMLNTSKVVYDTRPYYHYIIHDNNVCGSNYSAKKVTSLDALEKIINLLKEKNVNINEFKNYYMNMNISLLMNYLKEGESDKVVYNKLKNNLFKYNIKDMTTKSVKLAYLLARVNIHLCYFIWKKINQIRINV